MDIAQLITLIIGGSGVVGFFGTVYQVRKNSTTASAKTEVEAAAQESADWASFTKTIQTHMDYQDKQIRELRTEVSDLKQDRTYDREHIRILQRQIYAGIGPPPLRPGDAWPEDEVGG